MASSFYLVIRCSLTHVKSIERAKGRNIFLLNQNTLILLRYFALSQQRRH